MLGFIVFRLNLGVLRRVFGQTTHTHLLALMVVGEQRALVLNVCI